MTQVAWKFQGKAEQSKLFDDFISAMRFQGELLKKHKRDLEYAVYK